MKCFLCDKSSFKKKYVLKSKTILECKNDGLFLIQSTIKNNTYGKEYFVNQPHSFNQLYFLSKLRTIQKLTAKNQPYILDIGCGWGDFEEVLEKSHFAEASRGKKKIPYLGIDVNKEAIEICKEKGLNCKLIQESEDIRFEQLGADRGLHEGKGLPLSEKRDIELSDNGFDAITMFQVIEHLKNPLPTLLAAKKLLKPRGLLLITTPNNDSPLRKILKAKWSVYNEPSHYIFFNKRTLFETLNKAGFNNISVRNDNWRFLSLRYILNRLNVPMSFILNLTSNVPIPTDPFGDIETIAFKN